MTEWISVKVRLPENDTPVLCSDCEEMWVGYFLNQNDERLLQWFTYPRPYSDEIMRFNFCPTHWMELPELPKDCNA